MQSSLVRTVAPIDLPVVLDRVKLHLRVVGTDEDALIASYLSGAVSAAQREASMSFCLATYRLYMDDFPRVYDGASRRIGVVLLPIGPVSSVTEVGYKDAVAGASQIVSAALYDAAKYTGRVAPKLGTPWPFTNLSLENAYVEFTAGWPTTTDVPADAVAAILLIVADRYENRGEGSELIERPIPAAAQRLLRNLRDERY